MLTPQTVKQNQASSRPRSFKVIIEKSRDFYGTGIEIRAGFGPVGITEKKIGPNMSNF